MANTKKENGYKFKSQDFYELLETQKYKCPLTGRELSPENTTAENIVPLRKGGKHELANIYLVDRDVAKPKRYMTEAELIQLSADIIKTIGRNYGYTIRKSKKNTGSKSSQHL